MLMVVLCPPALLLLRLTLHKCTACFKVHPPRRRHLTKHCSEGGWKWHQAVSMQVVSRVFGDRNMGYFCTASAKGSWDCVHNVWA